MTRHGQSLVLLSMCTLALAIVIASRPALAAALVLASLLIVDGGLFLMVTWAGERLRFARHVGQGAEHGVVFCGHTMNVSIVVENPTRYDLYGTVKDLVPPGAERTGQITYTGAIPAGETKTLQYTLRGDHLASITFTGVALRFFSPGGLWRTDRYVPLPGSLRIVPDIFAKHFLVSRRKDKNVLLRHGRHLHRRPGLGAELLSLRPYQPGDPLKSVAWRASARRDKLLTKEFENEVPVRVRLLLQPSLRFWLDQQASFIQTGTFCARLARLLTEHRDLVELVVPHGRGTIRTGLGLTKRHLGAILTCLGEVLTAPQAVPGTLTARERQNFLEAALAHEPGLRRAADRLLAKRFRIRFFRDDTAFTQLLLALFLSVRYDLGVGGVALLERHEHLLGFFARRFAGELGIPQTPPDATAAAWALSEGPRWSRRLARTLGHLAAHARDEELYVIFADLAILSERERAPLYHRFRHGRAYGHRFVVFWPALPAPGGPLGDLYAGCAAGLTTMTRRLRALGIPASALEPEHGFMPVISQLNRLRSREGVRSW